MKGLFELKWWQYNMADSEGHEINPSAIKLDLLEVSLQTVLAKCDGQSKESIIEEIESDFDKDVLLEQREKAFEVAKARFENGLVQDNLIGSGETVDMTMARRTNKSLSSSIAKEILDMYMYIIGYSEIFPKWMIAKGCKYLDIVTDKQGQRRQTCNSGVDKIKIVELANILEEQRKMLNTLLKARDEDKVIINRLEQEMVQLQGQVKLLNSKIQTASQPIKSIKPSDENNNIGAGRNNQSNNLHNPNPHVEQASGLPTSQGATCVQPGMASGGGVSGGVSSLANHPPPDFPMHSHQQQQQQKPQQGTDDPEKQPANGSSVNNSRMAFSHVVSQDGKDHTTVIHRGRSLSKDMTAQVMEGKQPRFDHLHSAQPSSTGQASQNFQPYKQNTYRRPLRGVKQEKGSALYLQNIGVEDESDEDIGQMIKEYVREKGMRIMKYKVIRYRACYDTVGCRIIVPESQEHMALDPQSWPSEVKCRRWESPESWYKNKPNRYNGGHYDNDNGYDRFEDKYEESNYTSKW